MIHAERLMTRLMELSDVGAGPSGGVTRLSFTEEERKAKELVKGYMREAGLAVREDAVGNLIGRKEGTDPSAPIVLTGSHIDSVYNGGNFDGPLGVLSAIEALQKMREEGLEPKHPIEVIAFTDEEGARFGFGMIGSRGLAGKLRKEELSVKDDQGITLEEAMCLAGLNPNEMEQAVRKQGSVKAYIELHIEQGKVLEGENLPVGVVSGIAGPLWMKWTIEGAAGHAGTTPMNLRQDALAAASEIMLMIEQEAQQVESAVATVGQLKLDPGGINIIPGKVEFSIDLRHTVQEVRDELEDRMKKRAESICAERGVKLEIESLQRIPPVPCSSLVQDAILQACRTVGLNTRHLPSGAGHDGMQLAELCPMGMIFVRSKDGISHNPKEWSSPEDCAAGAHVLYHSLLNLAQE